MGQGYPFLTVKLFSYLPNLYCHLYKVQQDIIFLRMIYCDWKL